MQNKIKNSIEDTRKGFEQSFESGDYYNKQTQDKQHLERILNCLNITDGMKILDELTISYFRKLRNSHGNRDNCVRL